MISPLGFGRIFGPRSTWEGVFSLEEMLVHLAQFLGPRAALLLRNASPDLEKRIGLRLLRRAALGCCSNHSREFVVAQPLVEWTRTAEVPLLMDPILTTVFAFPEEVNGRNDHKQTPLMWAAGRGFAQLCDLMITAKADVEAVDSGHWSALFRAVWHGQDSAVKVLLERGADPANGAPNYTPLMAAARFGYEEIVRSLLAAKAEVGASSAFGETAMSLALAQRHYGVARILAGGVMRSMGPNVRAAGGAAGPVGNLPENPRASSLSRSSSFDSSSGSEDSMIMSRATQLLGLEPQEEVLSLGTGAGSRHSRRGSWAARAEFEEAIFPRHQGG